MFAVVALRNALCCAVAFVAVIAPAVPVLADQTVGAGQSSGHILLGAGESFINDGTITDDHTQCAAVCGTGNVGTITNNADGTISAGALADGQAIEINGSATAIINSGNILAGSAATAATVRVGGTVGQFTNNAGAAITSSQDVLTVQLDGNVSSFINNGSITGSPTATYDTVFIGGLAGSVTNGPTGVIDGNTGFHAAGAVSSFNNAGAITGHSNYSAYFNQTVGSFINSGTMTTLITGASTVRAITFLGQVGSFYNSGSIIQTAGINSAVKFDNGATDVVNARGGLISSTTSRAMEAFGPMRSFTNAGTIKGAGDAAVVFGYGDSTFVNDVGGLIQNTDDRGTGGGVALGFNTSSNIPTAVGTQSFINRGTILGAMTATTASPTVVFGLLPGGGGGTARHIGSIVNSGTISGRGTGLVVQGGLDSLDNSGSIVSTNAGGVTIDGQTVMANSGTISSKTDGVTFGGGTLNNSGTIVSSAGTAIVATSTSAVTVANSGVIRGAANAVLFGSTDDKLSLLTRSQIFGAVDFGAGTDTLDFAGFTGNTVLDVTSLQTLVPGANSYFDTRDAAGTGKVAIVNLSGVTNTTIGGDLGDITRGVDDLAARQIDTVPVTETPIVRTNYAPTPKLTSAEQATDTAVLTQLDVTQHMGVKVWGGGFGGGSGKLDTASLYGGIVAGSHARLNDMLSLGGLGGYVITNNSTQGGQQTLATQTGVLGFYGRASFGVADVDFALLGGYSGHTSSRQVVANNQLQTATGLFSSAFFAPSIGVTVPVLSADGNTLALKVSGSYVGGLTSAYTETGSSMNLAVGSQSINLVDARLGLEGRHDFDAGKGIVSAALVAKAGVFGTANMGSASVPVTAFNQTISVATPGSSAFGVYTGTGLDAQLTDSLKLDIHADASIRTDSVTSASVKASLSGTF